MIPQLAPGEYPPATPGKATWSTVAGGLTTTGRATASAPRPTPRSGTSHTTAAKAFHTSAIAHRFLCPPHILLLASHPCITRRHRLHFAKRPQPRIRLT